jgi:hypothetical protein
MGNYAKIHERPAMYIGAFGGEIDGSNLVYTFLRHLFYPSEFGMPSSVTLNVSGNHFTLEALGWGIPQPKALSDKDFLKFFEITLDHDKRVDTYGPVGGLRHIVWFAEYCLLDVTLAERTYRQAFLDGTPLTEPVRQPMNATPRLAFNFTLSSLRFKRLELDIHRFQSCVASWESFKFGLGIPEGQRPTLSKQWCVLSDTHYSLRIAVREE